jgi:predicted O-linked N-acetylglucosamine transferase (SPINDLY family)
MDLKTNSLLQEAIQNIQRNNFVEAKILLLKILDTEPSNFDALNIIGVITGKENNHIEAINFFKKAQKIRPDNNLVNFNLAKAFSESGNDLEAIKYYKIAIRLNKNHLGSYLNFGKSLHQLERYDEALSYYDQVIKLKPDYFEAYYNKGNTLKNLKRYDEALSCYRQVIKLKPEYFDAYVARGVIFESLKSYDEALLNYDQAIKLKPDFAEAYNNKALTLYSLKRYDEAIFQYDQAIKLKPDFAEAYNNKALTLYSLKRYDEAIFQYDQAIKLKPDFAEAYNNKALTLYSLKRYDEAIFKYDQAIKLKPHFVESYSNKGNIFFDLKLYDEALLNYDQAIKLKPDYAEAYNNKATAIYNLKRYEEALSYYDQAIKLKPDFAEAYNNKGSIYKDLKRYDEALFNSDQAIKLKPDFPEAYYNKGNIFKDLKIYDEALFNYEQAIKLKPDYEYLFGILLHMKMYMCDWQDFNVKVENLLLQTNENKKSSFCYPVLALTDSPSIQRKSSEIWINDKHPFNSLFGPILKSRQRDKIKIGYYSPDFREHPVTYLLTELIELHDKNQFELFGFYFGPPDSSKMHKRVSSAFNQFIDVGLKSDKDIALISRELGIDIAVDLTGFTESARTDIFSYRAAPIQVNYLGYPGTTGAEYIDYIIADPIIIPTESQQYYSEKIVYLPNSYQVNDRQRSMTDKVFTKDELGLPKDSFVFCCFNNNYKITPNTFDGWVRILKVVKGSVLWLLEDNPIAVLNLRKEAQVRGLDPNRLVFAKRANPPEHLARHRAADLFIDTLPYNAHTTASDALWAGLPVLTCMGESFASRVAASLLNAIELPELITTTQKQYEARAIELATNPEKLKAIKYKLERNRLTTALFDTPRFTKHIEAAYKQMYERYQDDLPLNNIYIEN